jgi:Zn-dependent protease
VQTVDDVCVLVELRASGDIIAGMDTLPERARRPFIRRAAFALALAATSALSTHALVTHAAPVQSPAAAAPIADGAPAGDHADQTTPVKARRQGVWGAVAGMASGAAAALGAAWSWIRRAAGSRVLRPVLKAAGATARFAFGGVSAMGRVGVWIGRLIWGAIAGVVALLAAIFGLSGGGAGAALVAGLALGAGLAAAAFWAARRFAPMRFFRRRTV